jgi:RNA polymerase sigma factor (sigma-70 family)
MLREKQLKTATTLEDLVVNHDRLACKRAHVLFRRLPERSLELDDLLQVAREGLLEAAQTWNPDNDRGASFATFAYFRINGALVDHVRGVIGREGQRLGVVNARSLDAALSGSSERTLLDSYDDHAAERELADVEGYDCIAAAGFDERERTIAAGMLNDIPLKTLARQLGISQSRVSQIVKKMEVKMIAQGMAPAHVLREQVAA